MQLKGMPRIAVLTVALGLLGAGYSSAGVPVRPLLLRGLAPHVAMVTVRPGDVLPLQALDPERHEPLHVRWSVTGGTLRFQDGKTAWKAPEEPGSYQLTGRAERAAQPFRTRLTAFVTIPTGRARAGVIAGYYVGRYPALVVPAVSVPSERDRLPEGFIRLDSESAQAQVSRTFTLGQFAVKDGRRRDKYMFLSPRLLEKLERMIDELHAEGYHAQGLRIMSGYRTPAYNEGIGNRTTLSRHTYGDAADVLADDWDGDGRITERDARILYRIADRLDHTTPLTGGLSLYHPTDNHGWFVHVDARGRLARW